MDKGFVLFFPCITLNEMSTNVIHRRSLSLNDYFCRSVWTPWAASVCHSSNRPSVVVTWHKIIGRPHTHTGGLLPLRAFCKQKCCNGWSQPGRSRSCCTSSTQPVTMETGCYTEAAERAERDGTANRSSSSVHCVVPIHVKSADTLWHHVIRYWKCCCVKCDKTDFSHILKKLHEFKCLSVMIFWKAKHYRNHLLKRIFKLLKMASAGCLAQRLLGTRSSLCDLLFWRHHSAAAGTAAWCVK